MKPKFSKYVDNVEGGKDLIECPPNEASHIHICFHDENNPKPCRVVTKGWYEANS